MPLTVKQAAEANQALIQLLKKDEENELIFASAVRIRLALNLRKTAPISDEFQIHKNELIMSLGDKAGETYSIAKDHKNRDKFDEEFKRLLEEQTDIELRSVEKHELAGVTKEEYENPKNPESHNQIPIDLLVVLIDTGLVKE